MMKTRPVKFTMLFGAACLAVGACTEGPDFQDAAATRSAVPAGFGRIAIYRTQTVQGFGVKPDVLVDGLPKGKCEVDSVFFVNVRPGRHTVSASTLETSVATVEVAAGQTAYVLCSIEVGPMVGLPKLVEASTAPDLNALVFTGQY